MKRITLSIITGVCLMIAGQASAHSGHHSHSNRGASERVTIITQPARPIIDVAISVPEIGITLLIIITIASVGIAMWLSIHPTKR